MRRGVHDLHVVRHNEFLQPLRNLLRQARLKIQQHFVREAKDIQVALHFALGRDERGVTAFAGGQPLHVIRHLAMEKSDPVVADQADSATKTQVQHAGRLAQGGALGSPIAVIADHFRSVRFPEMRAEAVMKFPKP